MLNPEIKRLQMKLMKSADPMSQLRMRCNEVRDRVKQITLPKLSLEDISKLKQHLTEYNKIKDNDLKSRFLNLRNAFLIIDEMEEDTTLKEKLYPILSYLLQFKWVFDLIIESQGQKPTQKLELVMQLLNFEIELFCIKYGRVLVDADVGTLPFMSMKKMDIEIDEYAEEIEESTEETMPEAMMPEDDGEPEYLKEMPEEDKPRDEYENNTEEYYRGDENGEDNNS